MAYLTRGQHLTQHRWGFRKPGEATGSREKERLMAKDIKDEVAYYYDFHPTEEDLMGETPLHSALI